MKMENKILSIELNDEEVSKICKEFDTLRYDKIEDFYKKYPNLHDLLDTINLHKQNRSHVTDRKINTF